VVSGKKEDPCGFSRNGVGEKVRPQQISIEIFGPDPIKRNVAAGFHLLESIVARL
jgi:hypothetical protein